MTLLSTLNSDMKTAMRAKDKERLAVIRMLKASLQNEEIKVGHELNADEELTILSREMKQRRDSLAEFEKAGREDLSEKVKIEIAIVEIIFLHNFLMKKFVKSLLRQSQTLVLLLPRIWQGNGAVMPKSKAKQTATK